MESEHLVYGYSRATAPAHWSVQSSGGIEMTKPAFSKPLLAIVAALAVISVPKLATARHPGGYKGAGGSHGGSPHGGGASHGGGHSRFKGANFKGGGHSYGGSRGSGHVLSARLEGGNKKIRGTRSGFFSK